MFVLGSSLEKYLGRVLPLSHFYSVLIFPCATPRPNIIPSMKPQKKNATS